jgi:tetratricopeptide (TPR) repeat protein
VAPDQARTLAIAAERTTRIAGDWASNSIAKRALGVAAMQLRDLDEAVTQLRAAVTAGRRAASPRLVGEARMSLASALTLRGATGRAIREIDAALRDLDGVAAARALVQRSAILQELGRVDEALETLRPALGVLRRFHDVQWEVRALNNRSILHIARRSFAAAEADLMTALELCTEHGLELPRAYAQQNLGCLKAAKGEVPAALAHFDRADEHYRRLGMEVGSLLVDRARLLLSVRLVSEARVTAEAAVRAYEKQKRMHLPEALLLLSTVAMVENDVPTAKATAARAAREFRRIGRRNWLALADYSLLTARLADDADRVTPAQARRSAEALDQAGWTVPSLEARVLAGRLALERGRPAEARADLTLAGRARYAGPADARARAWLGEALLRHADGRRYGALRALSAGLRVLEEHQVTLGATDLRAHVAQHRSSLARLGVRMSLGTGDARSVYTWAERGRALVTLQRPVHPSNDPDLARYLAELRTTMIAIERRRGTDRSAAALEQQQVALERQIRDHCRTAAGTDCATLPRPPTVHDLGGPLGSSAMVEYVAIDDVLHAVTVVDGCARLHNLGPLAPIIHALTSLPFALRRLANPRTTAPSAAAASALARRASAVLDDLLLGPLRPVVGDRPLVVVPTGLLQSLPWSILPSCAGRPVTVTPSATLWQQSVRRAAADEAGSVVVVAGPGLAGARAEAEAVAASYAASTLLVNGAATARHLADAMTKARLLHVAAHGQLRSDNPQFSSLRLSDGPFTVYDLELLSVAPHQVVLAACDTGRSHVVGDEVLGLASALLSQGTAVLVAPVIPVSDADTMPLMRAYHAQLQAGRAPAEALAAAQERTREGDTPSFVAAAGFICLGAGLASAAA